MPGFRKLFVSSPPEELLCASCGLVARDPYRSKCKCEAQLYCQMCIRELQNRSPVCSICSTTLESFADSLSALHIRAIKVECDNRKDGCGWKGQLGELVDSHLQSCPHQVVECPYADIGCSVRLRRREAEEHKQHSTEQHLQLAASRIQRLEAVSLVPPSCVETGEIQCQEGKERTLEESKVFLSRRGISPVSQCGCKWEWGEQGEPHLYVCETCKEPNGLPVSLAIPRRSDHRGSQSSRRWRALL